MELVDLLWLVIEKVGPLVEVESWGRYMHDPDRDLEKLVKHAGRVIDRGLLIGRGF